MRYQCELCGSVFDSAEECTAHEKDHEFRDRYGQIYLIPQPHMVPGMEMRYFIPNGRIFFDDGEDIVSGKEIAISRRGVDVRNSHFPLGTVKEMSTGNPVAVFNLMLVKALQLDAVQDIFEGTYEEWEEQKNKG